MSIRIGGQIVFDNKGNPILGNLQIAPASPSAGTMFFNENTRTVQGWNGTSWVDLTSTSTSSIFGWGLNTSGQLGNNTATNASSPVSLVGGFTDWMQVDRNVAIRSNGTAWCWGLATSGRLGDNTTTLKSSPVSTLTSYVFSQVSGHASHAGGVRTNGSVAMWGINTYGRLGDSSTTSRRTPNPISGGLTDFVEISCGYAFTLGLRSNGVLMAWGQGTSFQIGDGFNSNRTSPVSVSGGITDWIQPAAGYRHAAALRGNGNIYCWGINTYGRLGDGTLSSRSTPTALSGNNNDWVQVASGQEHGAAVKGNGTLWCWGRNHQGQLGNNSTTDTSSPVTVAGSITNWAQVSCGTSHTGGLTSDGKIYCWGRNDQGQLGDNTTTSRSSPVLTVGGVTNWVQIECNGSLNTFALRSL